MREIKFAGHEFVLDPSGMLIWPSQKTAIVADLHLEKASHFALRGQLLPMHDTAETLHNLRVALDFSNAETLMFLGDSFHDEKGYHRLEGGMRKNFEDVCKRYNVIWVKGNHDGDFVPPKTRAVDQVLVEGVMFRHEAEKEGWDEISGHYHPKAQLRLSGTRVSRPCFIEDGKRMILPAFGTFTGGLSVRNRAIGKFFKNGFTAHLLGEDKIYSIPSDKF